MTPSDHGAPRRASPEGHGEPGGRRWEFASRGDFEAVLRFEFPGVAGSWLAGHPDALGLSYGYVLFAVGPDGDTTARSG